jgi:hypothetical protein
MARVTAGVAVGGDLDSGANRAVLRRGADAEAERILAVDIRDHRNQVAVARAHSFELDVDPVNERRLRGSEAPSMRGVNDVRDAGPARRDATEDARLGRVRVHDVGPVPAEEAREPP